MINHTFKLENYFQEILYLIDNWINKGSGWIIEFLESQYINVSTYRPLSGSSYVRLPVELNPRKELQKKIKNLLRISIMMKLNFLCKKKIWTKLR